MRSRMLVLKIVSFMACLAFVAGCGPSFKAARLPSPTVAQGPTQTPSDTTTDTPVDGDQQLAADVAGTPGIKLISTVEGTALADKLILGVELEKGDKQNTLFVVMKDQELNEKPNVELKAVLSSEIVDESRVVMTGDKLEFSKIGENEIEIKKDEYTVFYRCLNKCATMEVNVQRVIGNQTDDNGKVSVVGFQASFSFELNTSSNVFELKLSSMTAKQAVPTATEARLLANPMEDTSAVESARYKDIKARMDKIAIPTIHHSFTNCDPKSEQFKTDMKLATEKAYQARLKSALDAGIPLTEADKKDPRLFTILPPVFAPGSKCAVEQAKAQALVAATATSAPAASTSSAPTNLPAATAPVAAPGLKTLKTVTTKSTVKPSATVTVNLAPPKISPKVETLRHDIIARQLKTMKLDKPLVSQTPITNCDVNSVEFKTQEALMKRASIQSQIASAQKAGIQLTESDKNDSTLFKTKNFVFPTDHMCNLTNKPIEVPELKCMPKQPCKRVVQGLRTLAIK